MVQIDHNAFDTGDILNRLFDVRRKFTPVDVGTMRTRLDRRLMFDDR